MRIRIIAALLALLMLTPALFACGRKATEIKDINITNPNYNNIDSDSFTMIQAASGDTVFYAWSGFYNPHISVFDGNRKHHVMNGLKFYSEMYNGDFFVLGDSAYFSTTSFDIEEELHPNAEDDLIYDLQEYKEYNFYRYDLGSKEHAKMFSIESSYIYTWYASTDFFAFKKYLYEKEDDEAVISDLYSLTCYDLAENTEILVCDSIVSCSVVSGKLRYLTFSEGTFNVFEYDTKTRLSEKLGDFSIDGYNYEEYTVSYHTYNYTEEKIIVSSYNDNYDTIAVYDIAEDTLCEYTLPATIVSAIAGEKYIFADIHTEGVYYYGEDENVTSEADEEIDGIYRIDLSDGSYEKLDIFANEDTALFVVSDDELIIEQGKMAFIRYKTTVFSYDVKNKELKELFSK
ncbi:MAG: hypothetical protein IJA52_07915 [Clostridia bacterium]|nr:hypothetical protein [Clostridia bacterium]